MSDTRGLTSLNVWQKSIELAEKIHKELIPSLPEEEKWALASQIRRSSQSIGANIAEGYGRYYYQETIRFCYIARGSLEETYTFLYLAKELGYVDENDFQELNVSMESLKKLIGGYIKYLKKTKRGAAEPGAAAYQLEPSPPDDAR